MGLFSNQFSNVVEWEEFREDSIFWKWHNREIKKGSKLIIRPGQDAIFLSNGKIEGIFKDDGEYDIESQIIPFLSTLKGFKFGFNSGMRAEVLFVNTKEFQVRWGTRSPINLPHPSMPGGLPIRANGTFTFQISNYVALIEKIAGVKENYTVENVKERITAILDQLLMKWIVKEGKDMFNLMANSFDISNGIKSDLDAELASSGMTVTGFTIGSINYPESVQKMIDKVAAQGMIGDVNRYQQVSMTDGISSGQVKSGGMAADMAGMMMGMQMAGQMMNQMNQGMTNQGMPNNVASNGNMPNFCPNCGAKTTGANFCPKIGRAHV